MSTLTDEYRRCLSLALHPISPQLSALHVSRYRLLSVRESTESNREFKPAPLSNCCSKCGSLLPLNPLGSKKSRRNPQVRTISEYNDELCLVCGDATGRRAKTTCAMPSVRRMSKAKSNKVHEVEAMEIDDVLASVNHQHTPSSNEKATSFTPLPISKAPSPKPFSSSPMPTSSNPIVPSSQPKLDPSDTPTSHTRISRLPGPASASPSPIPPSSLPVTRQPAKSSHKPTKNTTQPNVEPSSSSSKSRPKKASGLQAMLARNREQKEKAARAAGDGKSSGLADFLIGL